MMKQIDKVYEETFLSIGELNDWIKEQDFDVYMINIQRTSNGEGVKYRLYYGKLKK